MRLALLGIDAESLSLIRAAITSGAGELVVYSPMTGECSLVRELISLARAARRQPWETLLFADACDLVVAGRGGPHDERMNALRKLTQEGVPLLVVHPVGTYLEAVELDMIGRDGGGPLIPYSTGARHPALTAAGEMGNPGGWRQVTLVRELAEADRPAVLDALARDLLLLLRIAGRMEQVTAMGETAGGDLSRLIVGMTSATGCAVRWETLPAGKATGAKITLSSERASLRIEMPGDGRPWRAEWNHPSGRPAVTYEAFRSETDAICHAAEACAGAPPHPTWLEACHALEITATVEESLRRGRTIVVHTERHSEENTFKGLMAMGGCGLILAGFVALLVVAVIEGVRLSTARPDAETTTFWDWPWYWRFAPAYPFVAFLLLQLLRLVFRSSPDTTDDSGHS